MRPWILAGVAAGHAQAATLTCIGFFVIDRLELEPHGSEASIAIVMMAGASATLAAQWGLIPRLGMKPRALILSGSLVAAAGLAGAIVARDLYGITLSFALASLGFGFTRPGFTGGASLAVPLAEQGSVAGLITAANGISWVAAPALGMALYLVSPNLPFAIVVARARCAGGVGAARGCRRSRPPAPCRPRRVSGAFREARSRCPSARTASLFSVFWMRSYSSSIRRRDRSARLDQRGFEVGHRHFLRVEPAPKRGEAGAADEILEVGAGEALGSLRQRIRGRRPCASGMSSVWMARIRRRPAVSGVPT